MLFKYCLAYFGNSLRTAPHAAQRPLLTALVTCPALSYFAFFEKIFYLQT